MLLAFALLFGAMDGLDFQSHLGSEPLLFWVQVTGDDGNPTPKWYEWNMVVPSSLPDPRGSNFDPGGVFTPADGPLTGTVETNSLYTPNGEVIDWENNPYVLAMRAENDPVRGWIYIAVQFDAVPAPGSDCAELEYFACEDNCLERWISRDCGFEWIQDFNFPGVPCPCPAPPERSGSGPLSPSGSGSGGSGRAPCPQNCWMAVVNLSSRTYIVFQAYLNGVPTLEYEQALVEFCQYAFAYSCSPLYASAGSADAAARKFTGVGQPPTNTWVPPNPPCGPQCLPASGASGGSGGSGGGGLGCCCWCVWVCPRGNSFEQCIFVSNPDGTCNYKERALCAFNNCNSPPVFVGSYSDRGYAADAAEYYKTTGMFMPSTCLPGIYSGTCTPSNQVNCGGPGPSPCPQNCWVVLVPPFCTCNPCGGAQGGSPCCYCVYGTVQGAPGNREVQSLISLPNGGCPPATAFSPAQFLGTYCTLLDVAQAEQDWLQGYFYTPSDCNPQPYTGPCTPDCGYSTQCPAVVLQVVCNGSPCNQDQLAFYLGAGYSESPLYPSQAEAITAENIWCATCIWPTPSQPCGPDCVNVGGWWCVQFTTTSGGGTSPCGPNCWIGKVSLTDPEVFFAIQSCNNGVVQEIAFMGCGLFYYCSPFAYPSQAEAENAAAIVSGLILEGTPKPDWPPPSSYCGPCQQAICSGSGSSSTTVQCIPNGALTGNVVLGGTVSFNGVQGTIIGGPYANQLTCLQFCQLSPSGSGGGVTTPCCGSIPVPQCLLLNVNGSNDTGGPPCSCLNGNYPLLYNAGIQAWVFAGTLCGVANCTITLACTKATTCPTAPNNWSLTFADNLGHSTTICGVLDCTTFTGMFVFPGVITFICFNIHFDPITCTVAPC